MQWLAITAVLLAALAAPQIICVHLWGRVGLNAATLSLSIAVGVLCLGVIAASWQSTYTNPGGAGAIMALMTAVICMIAIGLGRLAAQMLEKKLHPAAEVVDAARVAFLRPAS